MIGYIVVTIGLCFVSYILGVVAGTHHCFEYLKEKSDEAKKESGM